MSTSRFTQRRRQERRRRWLWWAGGIGVLALLGGLAWTVWFSDVLGVRDVQVVGVERLEPDQVREAADVPAREPLARLDTVQIESRVAGLERVEQVSVDRRWPRTVRITVTERSAVGWVETAGVRRAVDRFGVDYATIRGDVPDGAIEIRTSATEPRQRQLAISAAASVIARLKADDPDLVEAIGAVTADTRDSVTLQLSRDRTVVWGSATKPQEKLEVLDALLEIGASEYDVSAPEQPTTRE